jgi:hypothetical protein
MSTGDHHTAKTMERIVGSARERAYVEMGTPAPVRRAIESLTALGLAVVRCASCSVLLVKHGVAPVDPRGSHACGSRIHPVGGSDHA